MRQFVFYTLWSDVAREFGAVGDFSFWGLCGEVMVINADNGEWHGKYYRDMLLDALR